MIHVETKTLPDSLRSALESLGYFRRDIDVTVRESFHPSKAHGTGYRAACVVVNLSTGERKAEVGDWGGSNMHHAAPVDYADSLALAPGFAAIHGSIGHKALLSLVIHPDNAARFLPEKKELSPRVRWILYCYDGLNPRGRKNEFERHGAPLASELNALVAAGYLKTNKAGASQITTAGKNALDRRGGEWIEFAAPDRSPE